MKNKYLSLIMFIFLCPLAISAQSTDLENKLSELLEGEPTILLGITGVNSLDSDSTEAEAWSGGGLELVRAFSTQVYPNLRPCSNEVRAVAVRWQNVYNLIPANDEIGNSNVKMQLWQPDYKGLFELNYLSKSDGTYARSWLNYYTLTGKRLEIETIQELYENYKVSKLWEELAESMGCSAE